MLCAIVENIKKHFLEIQPLSCLITIKLQIKYQSRSKMYHWLASHENMSYLDGQLPRLKNTVRTDNCSQGADIQNRACSSLCELSANICIEDVKNQSKIYVKKRDYGFSPWKVKKEFKQEEEVKIKKKKLKRSNKITINSTNEENRCCSSNKQNYIQEKKRAKQQPEIKKNTSIFFKIMAARELKGGFTQKGDLPDIQLIACLQRKRSSLDYIPQNYYFREPQKSETKPQTSKNLTPKIVNIDNLKLQDNSRIMSKKNSKHLTEACSQENKETYKKSIYLTDHWKTKCQNFKGKKGKKVIIMKDNKNTEARQIKQNFLLLHHKKGSLSLDRDRKQQYMSNNPLTRLLYEKYLHTIGICYGNKEKQIKFL